MATQLPSVMTFAEAVEEFTSFVLPYVRAAYEEDGEPDYPARCEEWNNWTDSLRDDERISDWQYENWSHPPCNG